MAADTAVLPDGAPDFEAIRAQFPGTQDKVFMNSAARGLLSSGRGRGMVPIAPVIAHRKSS